MLFHYDSQRCAAPDSGKRVPRKPGQGPKVQGSEPIKLEDMEALGRIVLGNKGEKVKSRLWKDLNISLKGK